MEITESVLIDDPEASLATLRDLRALGVTPVHRRFRHRVLVAELPSAGVENEVQRDRLRALGCDLAQGWLYGRPQPAETQHAWAQPAPTTSLTRG